MESYSLCDICDFEKVFDSVEFVEDKDKLRNSPEDSDNGSNLV